jgi:polyhydroxyalkanoate synthesis regulator phasin
MLRFLLYLLVFIIGGAIGYFFGAGTGGLAGALGGTCKVVNAAVANGAMTQEEADVTVKTAFGELATELKVNADDLKKGMPAILDQMKKAHGGTETACQMALAKI